VLRRCPDADASNRKLVLYSTAYNLGLVDQRWSDMVPLAAALLPEWCDVTLRSNQVSQRRLTALLLNPPDVPTAQHIARAVRCAPRLQATENAIVAMMTLTIEPSVQLAFSTSALAALSC
jgi:hypothetical protein